MRRKGKEAAIGHMGSVFDNNGYWYVKVRLPGEQKRRNHPCKTPGAKHAMRSDRPIELAIEAAHRLWENAAGVRRRTSEGTSVNDVCDAFVAYARDYYAGSGEAANCAIATRYFKDVFGSRSIGELVHADMLTVRDAMLRNPKLGRSTINRYMQILSRRMMPWALDRGFIRAATKVELSQVQPLKRGRSSAREGRPVREAGDAAIEATCGELAPNTAAMVRVHRLTGMRPGEICAMRREYITTADGAPVRKASMCEALGRGPWAYRPAAHKNDWRGDFGQPRVVLIGPKARAILAGIWGEADTGTLFSPAISVVEWMQMKRAVRKTPFYPCRDEQFSRARPDARKPSDTWDTCAYNRAIGRAAERAGVEHWAANQLRHSFATEVRRKFGLEACRAVLGHSMGAAVTDRYSYAAIEDEIIAKAREAVEALG